MKLRTSAWHGLFHFGGKWFSGIRYTASVPSGPMPFNIGHAHKLRKLRGPVALEMGSKRWLRRLENDRCWRACHLWNRTHNIRT